MQFKNKSYYFVALAVLLWGTTPAVSKLLLSNLNNLQVLLYTSLIATISLLFISIVNRRISLIKKYSFKDYITFAYMGFIGVFLYYFFFFKAVSYLPAQEASILNYLWPLTVVIFSIFLLKEKFAQRKFWGILLSFIGVYIVVSRGGHFMFTSQQSIGVIFALSGSIVYGLFSILGKKHNYDRLTSTMFYYLFTFIYTFLAIFLFSTFPRIDIKQFFGLAWLGIFTSAIAFVAWFLALKYGDTAKMSNLVFLTPFISLVYIHFLIGERILLTSIFGLVFIIAGIIIQVTGRTSVK